MGIGAIMIAVGVTVGYVGPAWTFFVPFPLGVASIVAGLSCWAFPDIDGAAERIVVELRNTEPNSPSSNTGETVLARPAITPAESIGLAPKRDQQISAPADDAERLVKRVSEEIRAVLSAQARQDLRWAWFFFLLGIPAGIVIQLLVR
jgi:hypothetical protein